jgi:hypothetical protein
MALKISPGLGRILRGGGELLALGFKREKNRELVRQIVGEGTDALEDGLSIEVDATDERAGVAVRRHRQKGGR